MADPFADQLLRIELAAQALSEDAQRRFIGVITHKARTPLATIRMNLEPLLTKRLDEKDKARLERIDRAAQRLQGLLAELDRSQSAETPAIELRAAAMNARDTIEDVAAGLSDVLDARAISLEADCDASARIICDPSALRLALVNLVGYAARFSRADAPIRLRCEHAAERINISVSYHSDSAAPPMPPGLNFRIYLAGALAEAQGGELIIKEAREKATSLTLSLPSDREVA